MRWLVHGQRPIYQSKWVELWLDDVQIPGRERFEHHVVRFSQPSVAVVAVDEDKVLLLWRHRFITDAWGWEVPAGRGEPGEDPTETARRELEEETGWRAQEVTPMTSYNALSGISDLKFINYFATTLTRIGSPPDASESSRVEWIPVRDIPTLAAQEKIVDGPSLLALTYYLAVWPSQSIAASPA